MTWIRLWKNWLFPEFKQLFDLSCASSIMLMTLDERQKKMSKEVDDLTAAVGRAEAAIETQKQVNVATKSLLDDFARQLRDLSNQPNPDKAAIQALSQRLDAKVAELETSTTEVQTEVDEDKDLDQPSDGSAESPNS